MRKAFKEWAFNLFTKRISIKISKLSNDEKIQFLVNKLMNELLAQGYDIFGSDDKEVEYLTLFCFKGRILVKGKNFEELNLERQRNV